VKQFLKTYWWALALSAAIIIVVLLTTTKKIEVAVTDYITEQRIKKLHPLFQPKVRAYLSDAKRQGLNLRITDGLRTWPEQAALYAKGRTASGSIVTNAKPGQSAHNYGLAIDVIEIGKDYKTSNWAKIGKIGQAHGFKWGGTFVSINDSPHLEDLYGYTVFDLQKKYNNGDLVNGYIKLQAA